MNFVSKTLGFACLFGLVACAAGPKPVDTRSLTLVEENHATVSENGVTYVMDSYIIPFQQPYYVKVVRGDRHAMEINEASTVAAHYIKPRGCTEPLSRRPDLDRSNGDNTQWLIGIEC